jgi:hypothetical protein
VFEFVGVCFVGDADMVCDSGCALQSKYDMFGLFTQREEAVTTVAARLTCIELIRATVDSFRTVLLFFDVNPNIIVK